ncbi:L-serine ammonia-lyase, iron-sulfur-dependent, subunit alpha [Serpentinicella sp. ANB-PHB4]|uniref:L-serine ammonia-lyase, iron-sulfur-dependent, subunit alpha n=1 Tax=Serpentinicella sp. ANB-PHB4 TaxID=3074076 RepID=UPI0028552211|nr:L-serine ammonia-lyase, iron-sulfur-dependent, subunit alpha [Serpentinicella sp. ANB-PHB4]MDR5658050.1 L-serine ammonia-lyase, iron-sulfur-dependent, subunit alpha [Serpentinicella sp. ANB-PHB4]
MDFTTGKELLEVCKVSNMSISEVMLEKEVALTEKSKVEIRSKVYESLKIMKSAIHDGLQGEMKSNSGLIGGEAKKVFERNENNKSVCGSIMSIAISRSMAVLEVNAAMGKIVAAPTAGSSGIIPGVLVTIGEAFEISDEILVEGLIAASAIGLIITRNATVSGASGGCQAETGSAAAMASAAIVELMGGTPKAALDAAAICIKNMLGLVCDPIAGLVEAPCQKRNAIGAANALISAEMALAGVESIIPFDEVVDTMYRVGKCIPVELRETAMGGLAATPTGKKLMNDILKNKQK